MNDYLTAQDVAAYGHDLLDVAQRSALHAISPHLQHLEQQNEALQRRLAQEARHRLDSQVAMAVPNYQEIDSDPRWHHWLRGIDPLTGRTKQTLLNDAIASGDVGRIALFFRGFMNQAGDTQQAASAAPNRTRSSSRQIYSRDQVRQLYESHRKGEWAGREQEWNRLEYDIIRAGAEGRIAGGVDVHGK